MTRHPFRAAVAALPFLVGSLCLGQRIAPPVGMYCSCPPTHSNSVSVLPGVAEKDFVDGVLVRVSWRDLEPSRGVYDWSFFDSQIAAAETYGIRVSFSLVGGAVSPAWLAGEGVEYFDFMRGGTAMSMPVPWDETYLGFWLETVAAFGERYADEETVSLVYATVSSGNGFEMQLPFSPADQANWAAFGYTDELYADAWETVIDAFAAAFPRHTIAHDVHPVLGSDAVAERVVAYADEVYGGRVGVLAAWWMERNAFEVYPGMFTLLREAAYRSHPVVQVANSYTNTPERFGPDGIVSEIELSLVSGIRYMEVWNSDILNGSLETLLRESSARLGVRFGDANRDGAVNADDLYTQTESPTDLDENGTVDDEDRAALERLVREREPGVAGR